MDILFYYYSYESNHVLYVVYCAIWDPYAGTSKMITQATNAHICLLNSNQMVIFFNSFAK